MGSDDFATRTTGPLEVPGSFEEGRFAPGVILANRYRIVGLLGRGGMGEVYRADDLMLRQSVALKLLPDTLAADPVRLSRFVNEVRVARQVTHVNVCRVHDIGVVDGHHFLSMEYVDGENLASLLSRIGRLPKDKAVEITQQICAGLAAAHDRGVLHRDLKPANVMIDGRGRARLTDFGLAVFAADPGASHDVAGTPAYMSPEQAEGKPATVRSDIYAVGLILYEMLTGQPAFRTPSISDMLRMQRETAPPKPSSLAEDLDPDLERLVLLCLEKDPARRPASALAVSAALSPGDPLAALVAAGQTPPPELVAAAGQVGGLRPAVAWACLVFVIAGALAAIEVISSLFLLRQVPLEKPPDVLEERGREILRDLAHVPSGPYTARGFTYDETFVEYLTKTEARAGRYGVLEAGQPAALQFWFRRSPDPLAARNPMRGVTLADPAPTVPGMAHVRLDTRGRLVELLVVPPATDTGASSEKTTAWPALLGSAGFDRAKLRPVEPESTPPVFADERVAWEGFFPDAPQYSVRIEAAAYRGRPVWFQILGPWSRAVAGGPGYGVPSSALGILPFLVVVGGAVMALRNLRLGRGDRRGALRLSTFVFVVRMIVWALGAPHTTDMMREWMLFSAALAFALLWAGWSWAFYMAVEPFVRRRWPRSLISWSRLLSGRFRDPLVGRDLLLGVSFGILANLLLGLGRLAPAWLGAPSPHLVYAMNLNSLLGSRFVVVGVLLGPLSSLMNCLVILVGLLLLRVILRREWLALLAAWLLSSAVELALFGTGHPINALSIGLLTAMVFTVLARFGLLPLLVLFLTLEIQPLTPHLTAWYGQSSVAWLVVVLAVSLFGFRSSLAHHPLVSPSLLDH